MNLEIESHDGVKIVRVKEDRLVYSLLSSFFSKVSEVVEGGSRNLVLDLSQVPGEFLIGRVKSRECRR